MNPAWVIKWGRDYWGRKSGMWVWTTCQRLAVRFASRTQAQNTANGWPEFASKRCRIVRLVPRKAAA